jgi:hypothetical protein
MVVQCCSGLRSSALQAAQQAAQQAAAFLVSIWGACAAAPLEQVTRLEGLFGPSSADFVGGVVRALPAALTALRLHVAVCGVQLVVLPGATLKGFAALHRCLGSGLLAWAGCLQTVSRSNALYRRTAVSTSTL